MEKISAKSFKKKVRDGRGGELTRIKDVLLLGLWVQPRDGRVGRGVDGDGGHVL